MFAASHPNFKLTELFVRYGADINAQDNNGMNVLMWGQRGNFNPKIVELLVNLGADVTIKDKYGKTAADYARSDEQRNLL